MDTEDQVIVNGLTLAATPTAVPLARALVRLSLNRWGHRALIDDAELLVSELTTNAVQASDDLALIRAYIGLYADKVRLEVWDRADDKPQAKDAGDDDEGGRGLLLVEALSADWGWYARGELPGKVVWADLLLPPLPVRIPAPLGHVPHIEPTDLRLLERIRDGLLRL